MLFNEFQRWVVYRNARGTISSPRRIEQALARVCVLICNAAGIKKDDDAKIPFSVEDFMPNEDGFNPRRGEITLEEAIEKGMV